MRKPVSGVSYIEMVIAAALFSILMLTTLPLINQAALNLEFAQDGYRAHLAAQSIQLAIRDATTLTDKESIAAEYAARLGIEYYTVWFFSQQHPEGLSFGSANSPSICTSIDELFCVNFTGKNVIVVVVSNSRAQVIGRSVGINL